MSDLSASKGGAIRRLESFSPRPTTSSASAADYGEESKPGRTGLACQLPISRHFGSLPPLRLSFLSPFSSYFFLGAIALSRFFSCRVVGTPLLLLLRIFISFVPFPMRSMRKANVGCSLAIVVLLLMQPSLLDGSVRTNEGNSRGDTRPTVGSTDSRNAANQSRETRVDWNRWRNLSPPQRDAIR